MQPQSPTIQILVTEESVKTRKGFNEAHERVIDWFATDKLVYWDLERMTVAVRPTITELARDLGISRQTIYNWGKTLPNASERIKRAREGVMIQNCIAVWNSLYIKALTGNIKAAEMYLTNFDPDFIPARYKAQFKKEHEANGGWVELLQEVRKQQARENRDSNK